MAEDEKRSRTVRLDQPVVGSSSKKPQFTVGDVVCGRYSVTRFIERGGMGEVYEVVDRVLEEPVALKALRAEFANDEKALARFRREIQLARKVTHPNVCRIFDIGVHESKVELGKLISVTARNWFLTMELLSGESLGSRVRNGGPFSVEAARPVVAQLAGALDAAHQAGIIHRDFKSGNILLEEGRAVVTDFGLARAAQGGLLVTTEWTMMGSPYYMAPEQVQGGELGTFTDVYALGVVLYEMMTGQLPFRGHTPLDTATMRLEVAPAPPRRRRPDLDPRWEAAILRCLEREPAARFQRASDVLAALPSSV